MNYWIEQENEWTLCFRGVEILVKAEAPERDFPHPIDLVDMWKPVKMTVVEADASLDASGKSDFSILCEWILECIDTEGRPANNPTKIPLVLCRIDPKTNEELEIWCIRDARLEDFEFNHNDEMKFSMCFNNANMYRKVE